jgi:hypothetical protein
VWAQHSDSSAGLDVARAQYLDLTGQQFEFSPPAEGRRWLVEDWDAPSSVRYYRDGELKPGEWVRSFRGVQETALFSLHDPIPIIIAAVSDVTHLLARYFTRRRSAATVEQETVSPGRMTG